MDAYGDFFQWHEKYVPLSIEADRLLLLSDGDALLFSSPGVAGIARVLAQSTTVSAYCEGGASNEPLAAMLHALESLAGQGYVQARATAGARAGQVRYEVPDFSMPFTRRPVSEAIDAINLSLGVDDVAARDWARQLPLRALGQVTVVFCDDLLDPRRGCWSKPRANRPCSARCSGPAMRARPAGNAWPTAWPGTSP
jgi:hypothetical protein